ncbi:MAG: ATP-dependent DNA helicase [Eubacteriales bacterium]
MGEKNFADISHLLHKVGILKENERIIGFVDCAILLERKTEKGFSYHIADPQNFKTYHLCKRKLQLPQDRYGTLKEKADKWGEFKVPLPLLESTSNERAKALLEEVFTEIMPNQGMKFRKQQMELSLTMLDALQKKLIALCEAEVGTGKTHAYILAIAIKNLFTDTQKSAVISTSTIALQKALTDEYLPQISTTLKKESIIMNDLDFVVRKGKKHYICDKRLNAYISSIKEDEREAELVAMLTKLSNTEQILDLDLEPFSNYVKERICVTRCDPKCGFKDICRYQQFLYKCRHNFYDFQIVNHNYLIADMLMKKRNGNRLLADFGVIVIDEAHKMPDTIKSMYGERCSSKAIPRVMKRIDSALSKKIPECIGILERNDELFEALTYMRKASGNIHISNSVSSHIKLLQRDLRNLCNNVELLKMNNQRRLKSIVYELEKIAMILTVFTKPEEYIIWIEAGEDQDIVMAALSKQLNEQINKDLWELGIPIIMTSGTISVRGDFTYLERSAGLKLQRKRMVQITTESPFDYKAQALLYLPKGIPFPKAQDESYIQSIIDEIKNLIEVTHGHTLILFTSYRMMEQVYHTIKEMNLKYPMFMMGRGKLNVLDEFRISKNGVLFASDSAGEGIDLAGDILSSLIVVKLPFPIPNAVSEYEISLQENFEGYLTTEIIPTMIIKLRQWIGRGIRRETDTCVFSILDSRAAGRYYEEIIEALPKMPVTRKIEDVGAFILNKKEDDYFND